VDGGNRGLHDDNDDHDSIDDHENDDDEADKREPRSDS
jgi:hypothetical protein